MTFTDQDRLTFETRSGKKYQFYIENKFNGDSVYYHLVDPTGKDVISDEKRFLIRGLSLNSLLSGVVVDGADFDGIHVIRPEIYTQVKKKERIETYASVGYALEFQASAFLPGEDKIVRVGSSSIGSTKPVGTYRTEQLELSIPLNLPFSIGYDDTKTKSVRFVQNEDKQLSLLYTMPQYHYFAPLSNRDDNTVYVSTNIRGGNSYNLPENIMLFNLFEKWDNVNQLQPFFLSYVAGPTTEQLQFDFYCPLKGKDKTATLQAGQWIPQTKAVSSSLDWLMQIENFRETTPFSITKMKWTLFAFALALTFLLCFGAFDLTSRDRCKRNVFTPFEFVLYAVLIYLLTFRFFLLWRTSVFVPVEQISLYELTDIFRNQSNYTRLCFMLTFFVTALFIGKLVILHSKRKPLLVHPRISR